MPRQRPQASLGLGSWEGSLRIHDFDVVMEAAIGGQGGAKVIMSSGAPQPPFGHPPSQPDL